MLITRLRPDIDIAVVTNAVRDFNPEKASADCYAMLTVKGEGDSHHAFLLAANSKADKDITLLEAAKGDKVVTVAVKEGDGTEHVVTGKVESYVKLRHSGLAILNNLVAGSGLIVAGWTGVVVAINGLAGTSLIPSMGAIAAGILGTLSIYGAAVAFARAIVKPRDGVDWAQETVAMASEGPSAQAHIQSVENAPRPEVALPMPTANVAFVIPAGVAKQKVLV